MPLRTGILTTSFYISFLHLPFQKPSDEIYQHYASYRNKQVERIKKTQELLMKKARRQN